MFITFEGIDGSGKTTQIKLLQNYLISLNKEVVLTREPGGTPLAEQLREVLLGSEEIKSPLTEFLILTAGRHDHIENLIKPALDANKIVISDRFYESSVIYQGYAKGLNLELMDKIQSLVNGDFAPNITFVLDVNPQKSLLRINDRQEKNFYDDKKLSFHQKLRDGFLEIAKNNPKRIKIIDASLTAEEVHKEIINHLANI